MAGSGYLTQILYDFGFHNIFAIEACNEMSYNADIFKKIKLYSIPDISVTPTIIKNINPHVVVSLASFHHLIEYNKKNGTISKSKSIQCQFDLIKGCMEAMRANGIFLISDLAEANFNVYSINDSGIWKAIAKNSHGKERLLKHLPFRLVNDIESFHGYLNYAKKGAYINSEAAFSLTWFREIVERDTPIGHKDMALSKALIKQLNKKYDIYFSKYPCPWVFESKDLLAKFITKKFCFSINPEEVYEKAVNMKGICSQQKTVSFGWDLGLLLVKSRDCFLKKKNDMMSLNILLVCLFIILCVLIFLKVKYAIYVVNYKFAIQALFGIFVGSIITILIKILKSK